MRKLIQESNANINKEKIAADVKEVDEIFEEIMNTAIKGSQITSYNKTKIFTTAKLGDLQKHIPSVTSEFYVINEVIIGNFTLLCSEKCFRVFILN